MTGEAVEFVDGETRLSAVWRDDRVTVDLWRSAARGWVGTGAVCGTRRQVLGWLDDDRHWPDARPFLSRLRGWLDRTGPVETHVAG